MNGKQFEDLKTSRIGIIGIGYIGGNLYRHLRNRFPEAEIFAITEDNIKLVETTEFDYFIDSAGNSGDFREDILGTIESNVDLLLYLFRHLKVRKTFIYLSSTRVYGFSENDQLFDENYHCIDNHQDLNYIYNGTKKLCESIVVNYGKKLPYKTTILRLSNVYGLFDELNDATLIKKIVRCAKAKENIIVGQNINSTKDYIHIKDVIQGILLSLIYTGNEHTFNIAYGKSHSLADITQILNIKIEPTGSHKIIHSSISIKKSKKELGFSADKDLVEGLKNEVQRKVNQK